MNRNKCFILMTLMAAVIALSLGVNQSYAQSPADEGQALSAQSDEQSAQDAQGSNQSRRQDARERLKEAIDARRVLDPTFQPPETNRASDTMSLAPVVYPTGINPLVDVTLPNYANSPNLSKFVDSLPGLGSAHPNNRGKYIPLANPDTTTYPGSDYYEIGLAQYNQQLHSELPAVGTRLRGYYQINTGTTGATDHSKLYLGPVIIGHRDKPVRLKFVNQLGINGAGDLPLPVDMTVMGAGMGPLAGQSYTQNRADVHLHGGFTPWISDGTPHQWVTPALDLTNYKKGDSFQNVPDMVAGPLCAAVPASACIAPAAGDAIGTYYYTNQQSARLMFYHDHAYGITRLNVYAGEASGYLLTDPVEEDLINGTNVSGIFTNLAMAPVSVLPDIGIPEYKYGIPLIIQDKTFVTDVTTPPGPGFAGTPTPATLAVDPLWSNSVAGSTGGDLWLPHEYMPNENIYNLTGFNVMGRWDYAPWMIPPMLALNNTLPSPTIVPEAFMDTVIVNGSPFPYLELPPTVVRFRILNACNDRMLNLQLYKVDPLHPTEVKMVDAVPNPTYPTWPRDGRDGGVPDPTTQGPSMIQIGNEAGFLAAVNVVPPQPVDYDYNRRSVTFGGVTSKALYLPPAVRADVIVDLSTYVAGDILMLYNDAPAPMPLYDTRNDYYSGDPDQRTIGGAPTTPIGYGPNTRTVMQIRIVGSLVPSPFSLTTLTNVLPKVFAFDQDHILVPESAYNAAYGTTYPDVYAKAVDESLNKSGTTQGVSQVVTTLPGLGYVTPPAVAFYGGGITGGTPVDVATATATLNGVTGITLVTAGSGYSTPPLVTFTGGGGTGAAAAASISGGVVTVITVTNPGSNYTTAPLVAITGGGGAGATATATNTLGSVGAITLTHAGSGYMSAPLVYLTGGGGTGAGAAAMLNGSLVMNGKNLVEGFDMEFGRMNAQLGSTPNPLAPTVGAGPVVGMAFYIDPPTEILTAGQTVLWRFSHLGVDSHAIHFHLFNVQVVNRVDWTNTIKPPYPEELGWKETIRTNPFEDIIVAIKPVPMNLPFQIPNSNRLLDVTTVAGSTQNFLPVAPPIGLPAVAGTVNVMTNFGWEYVWHCHLLGHEENDMMRPIVFVVPQPIAPTNLAAVVTFPGAPPVNVALSWVSTDVNTTGYTIQRSTTNTFPAAGLVTFKVIGQVNKTYNDTTPLVFTRYFYRVRATNGAGNSAWSNVLTVTTAVPPTITSVVSNRTGTTDNAVVNFAITANAAITSFTLQRSTSPLFTPRNQTTVARTLRILTQTLLTRHVTYYFRMRTNITGGSSAWSPIVSVTTP